MSLELDMNMRVNQSRSEYKGMQGSTYSCQRKNIQLLEGKPTAVRGKTCDKDDRGKTCHS